MESALSFSNLKDKIHKILRNILGLNLCHEESNRCLNIFGTKFPICARCFGILIGIYVFTPIFFIYFLHTPVNAYYCIFVPLLLFPGFVDGFTQLMQYRLSNNMLRLITGFFIGVGTSLFANILTFTFLFNVT